MSPVWIVVSVAAMTGSIGLLLIFVAGLSAEIRRPSGTRLAAVVAKQGYRRLPETEREPYPDEEATDLVQREGRLQSTRYWAFDTLDKTLLRDVRRDPELRRVVVQLWRELAESRQPSGDSDPGDHDVREPGSAS